MSQDQAELDQAKQGGQGLWVIGLLFVVLVILCAYVLSIDSLDLRDAEREKVKSEQVDHQYYLQRMLDEPRVMAGEGAAVYSKYCLSCHGVDGNLALAQARRLGADPLLNDIYGAGAHPLSMFATVTKGFRMMPPQTHLSIDQRYAVVHYIREDLIKKANPSQYVKIDDELIQLAHRDSSKGSGEHEPQK